LSCDEKPLVSISGFFVDGGWWLCSAPHHVAKIEAEFPGLESCSGHAKRQRRIRIDLAGRPSLRIKPGDLILNRQHDATLLQSLMTAHQRTLW
jgi:hypothetical protein